MDERIVAALEELERVFRRYPRRPVLERCPHCGPPVRVADVDLYWLSIKLGNTVGDDGDVKALLPLLFERLIGTRELDAEIVLGKLAQRNWPSEEQSAIDNLLDQVWRQLLAEFPSCVGGFEDVSGFFGATAAAGLAPDRFLAVWDATPGEAPDLHLAEFVNAASISRRLVPALRSWIGRNSVRDRLLRAYERCHEDRELGDFFARAYDAAWL
ncbi:hypothetical protein GPX89_06525 [Nocardia sp. ET3-3]|uniref:Uncharacterized protein n=1 Tax=Nocardia terrae TaxID=2675851 RepID=A0A7K1USM0_9NOCA|nr:hypothetical protein [Nocardia terrae]MVU76898.1 hypothetical protein [Nocardia terrae]